MESKHILIIAAAILAIALAGMLLYFNSNTNTAITSFEECAQAGYPVMESYPPQCHTAEGQTFTQNIGNELDKNDLIRISSPRPNATVSDPLIITGEARGTWFFEASFPIHLQDASGQNITTAVAQAEGEWMTEEFVPFQATLDIPATFSGEATLVLEKDNPSGLPEHDDSLRVPITVAPKNTNSTPTTTPSETIQVKAYFSNTKLLTAGQDECTTVFPAMRTVPKTTAVARVAIEQLLVGPTATEKNQGYATSINSGVRIQKLTIENGIARIDLSEELDRAIGGACRVTAIRKQITETLLQFSTVQDVVISINGRTEDILQP